VPYRLSRISAWISLLPSIKGLLNICPTPTEITFDHFHLMKLVEEAVDTVDTVRKGKHTSAVLRISTTIGSYASPKASTALIRRG
jgi:hypothetical protein